MRWLFYNKKYMQKKNNSVLLAHLGLISVGLIYGANFHIAKLVMPHPIPALAFVFMRIAFAAILFGILYAFNPEKIDKKDYKRFLLCTLTGVTLNQALFFKGVSLTTSINGALLMMGTPLLVLIIEYFLSNHKPLKSQWLGVAMGLAGAALLLCSKPIINHWAPNPLLGNTFVFINALSFGTFLVLVRPLMQKYNTVTVMFYCFACGIPIIAPLAMTEFATINWSLFTIQTYLSLFYVLFFVTFLAYMLNAHSLKKVKPSVVGAYIYLQPLVAGILAVIYGYESFRLAILPSAVLIAIGVGLVAQSSPKKQSQ